MLKTQVFLLLFCYPALFINMGESLEVTIRVAEEL